MLTLLASLAVLLAGTTLPVYTTATAESSAPALRFPPTNGTPHVREPVKEDDEVVLEEGAGQGGC